MPNSLADYTSWYAGHSLLTLVLRAVLAGYAFHLSLAGRPLFRGDLFDVGEKARPQEWFPAGRCEAIP